MIIHWLSRHAPTAEQLNELALAYGEVQVVQTSETVPGVDRVKELVSESGAQVLVAVLPLPILAQCVDPRNGIGIPVLRADMGRVLDEQGNATFIFKGFEKVLKVEVITEPLVRK